MPDGTGPTLHGTRRSRASRNLWLAEEAGLSLPLVEVWQARRLDDPDAAGAPTSTRSAGFLVLNPMGSIPVLVDGDLVLTESLAINLYLGRAYGGDLAGQGAREEGEVARWTLLAATSVEAPALLIQQAVEAGEDKAGDRAATFGRLAEPLRGPFAALEAHLATHEWLVGGRFTVADVNVAECVRYAQGHPGLLSEFPALDAWLRRCQARPAFQRMWAAREAEPVRK